MIRVCLQLACAAADGLAVAQCEALDHYGTAIALAFQIQDDVLDIEASRSDEPTLELQSLMRRSYAVFCLNNKTADDHRRTTGRLSQTTKTTTAWQGNTAVTNSNP